MRTKVLEQWKTVNTNLANRPKLVTGKPHQIGCFTPLSSRHEELIGISKGDKSNLNGDVWVDGFKRLDGLKEDVLFLAFSGKGVPYLQRDGVIEAVCIG